MNQYLKDFILSYKEWNMQSCANEDQFISDYLKDHPLPLPTNEEIGKEAITNLQYMHDCRLFVRGAKWVRDQIKESLK